MLLEIDNPRVFPPANEGIQDREIHGGEPDVLGDHMQMVWTVADKLQKEVWQRILLCVCVHVCISAVSIASLNRYITSLLLTPEPPPHLSGDIVPDEARCRMAPNLTSTLPCSTIPRGEGECRPGDDGPSTAVIALAACPPAVRGHCSC